MARKGPRGGGGGKNLCTKNGPLQIFFPEISVCFDVWPLLCPLRDRDYLYHGVIAENNVTFILTVPHPYLLLNGLVFQRVM